MAAGFRSPLPLLGLSGGAAPAVTGGFRSPLPFLGIAAPSVVAPTPGFRSPLFLLGFYGIPGAPIPQPDVLGGAASDHGGHIRANPWRPRKRWSIAETVARDGDNASADVAKRKKAHNLRKEKAALLHALAQFAQIGAIHEGDVITLRLEMEAITWVAELAAARQVIAELAQDAQRRRDEEFLLLALMA